MKKKKIFICRYGQQLIYKGGKSILFYKIVFSQSFLFYYIMQ